MPDVQLRGSLAIVGIGETEVGSLPGHGSTEICVDAARRALADAGLEKERIDGLITCNPWVERHLYHAEMVSEYMQIFPRYTMTLNAGGAGSYAALHHAATAILAGLCDTVLITAGDNPRTGLSMLEIVESVSSTLHPQFEAPYGMGVQGFYALAARAHMHEFGTTSEQLAAVAVDARRHAALHPGAELREPIEIRDVLESRVVADPLHQLDCSLWSDGGAAVVVTAAERARDFPHRPVYMLGIGEGHWHEHLTAARSLVTSAASESGERAYAMAGLGPADMDFANVYDCFTSVAIVELEDLGFCKKGEGGPFVADGNIRLGAALPVNTHGGLLCHSHTGHPGSMFALTEAVIQLRGDAGERQVAGAEVGLAHAQGGVLSSHCTVILGRELS
jgi:acetyl-CoA acetyltransferase